MATYVPPRRATEYITYVALRSQANTKLFQVNPTLAAGDVKVIKDGGAPANITTLPTAVSSGAAVKLTLSGTEMTADNVTVLFQDASGAEWCDLQVNIQTSARQIDDLAFPTTSGHGLDVTATGAAGIDWGNVENPTTTVGLSGTTIKTATDVETGTQDIRGRLPAALTAGGNIKADMLAISGDTTAADSLDGWIDSWHSGTARAGGAANTVLLEIATASAADDFYNGGVIYVTGGTGAKQGRMIDDYVGTLKLARIIGSWHIAPDATSTYVIIPMAAYTNLIAIYNNELAAEGLSFAGDEYMSNAYISGNILAVGGNYGAATNLKSAFNGDGYNHAGNTYPWTPAWDAEVQSDVQDALEANHLDHLLAADYDPANKPGVATALLNELIGNDGGVSQFTANALELAPSGGGGGGLTQQEVRDAMKLAPTAGDPADGSIDAKLDDLAVELAALGGTELTIISVINGNNISVFKGDTWEFTLSGLGDISGYETFAFIAKYRAADTDAQAMLLVRSDDGLVKLAGADPISAANGTLTPGSGAVTVQVAMAETANATPGEYTWWLKVFDTTPNPDEAFTLAKGNFQINKAGYGSIAP